MPVTRSISGRPTGSANRPEVPVQAPGAYSSCPEPTENVEESSSQVPDRPQLTTDTGSSSTESANQTTETGSSSSGSGNSNPTSSDSATSATNREEASSQTTVSTLKPSRVVESSQPPEKRPESPAEEDRNSKKMKKQKIGKLKREIARLQMELSAARIASIEADNSEEDVDSEIESILSENRVNTWFNRQNSEPVVNTDACIPTESSACVGVNQTNKQIEKLQPSTAVPEVCPDRRSTVPEVCPDKRFTEKDQIVCQEKKSDIAELAMAIALAVKTSNSSSRFTSELPFFNGNYQEWLTFKAAVTETMHTYSDIENVCRLRRCLKGKAREAVERLLYSSTSPQDILKALEARFGRPDSIAIAEIEQLRNLPKPSDNPRDICIFSSKVSNIISTLQALNREYYLYNPEVTKITIEKLSPTLRHEWFKFSSENKTNVPDLLRLNKFLEKEAEFAGPYAVPETIESFGNSHQSKKQRTYTSVTEENKKENSCPLCDAQNHKPADCKKFKEADCNARWELAKKHKLCFRCLQMRLTNKHTCKRKNCDKNGCQKSHHHLLHFEKTEHKETEQQKTETINSTWHLKSTQTYLKIIPITVSGPAGEVDIHALLDDGSTVTLIDSEVADKVGARGRIDPLYIEAITDKSLTTNNSRRVTLTLKGNSNHIRITARTMPDLSLSIQKVEREDIEKCPHLMDIIEQLQYKPVKPRMLIGQDNWNLLLSSETRRGSDNQPVASLTPLGWVLHGTRTRSLGNRVHYVNHADNSEERMEDDLRKFFAIESLTITPKLPQSDPEKKAINILKENTKKIENNQYEVPLLWKNIESKMPDNYDQTVNRLHTIEKKIDKNPSMRVKYEQQMELLISKGYAERAPSTRTEGRTWYLPHFGVVNPMKPEKLRIVHDAAAVTRGVSLNNQLLTGPDLLKSLPGVLMRFRQHRVAICGDIAEMFMQIKIRPEDRDMLRYLWRGQRREGPPDEYRMSSLIFGATCSPSIAIYIKNMNAEQYREQYPRAVTAIINNHYVDDYLDSYPSEKEAIETAKQVRDIHREAHYELRQWCSNSSSVLKAMIGEDTETQQTTVELNNSEKDERVLGLIWKPKADELTFNLNLSRLSPSLLDSKNDPTKREVLKVMMSLYDPLGLASPIVIKSKKIMQEIWRRGTPWDEPIDEDLSLEWTIWLQHLNNLARVPIPRAYRQYTNATSLQLHVFTDASETAYAASIYWRAQTEDGQVHITLVMGKAKVTPLKLTSIPRLELQAAVMGSRMALAVIQEHDRKPDSITYWTDSKTVLTWLRNGTRSYKPFVAHRIAEIEENSSIKNWRWIPTKHNVADDATREVPQDFNQQHRWFQGPSFLYEHSTTWPCEQLIINIENTGEEKVNHVKSKRNIIECIPDSTRFSKWEKIVRTTARVLQFIDICKKRKEHVHYKRTLKNKQSDPDWRKNTTKKSSKKPMKKVPTENPKKFIPIEANTLKRAEQILIRGSQSEAFQDEIDDLTNNRPIQKSSRLRSLTVTYIDGVIRLKSRIANASEVSEIQKSPPIIDGNNRITQLWIEYTHRKLNHAGAETTLNECRQHMWVLRLRPTTKKIIHRCLPCRIRKEKPAEPQTGDHPLCRLGHHQRPFTYTGVDYFGPITVTVGRKQQKRYIALFTCLTTRAVHLEVADTLSTDSAVMALRRLIARRGQPTEMWSDNGTNLRGASKELNAIEHIQTEANAQGIRWKFIPPGAPFMGGAWERLVRSVKTSMNAVFCDRNPSDEVLRTVIAEAEYTVNSRPLTHVSTSADDEEALTPNHFLLGGSARITTMNEFDEKFIVGKNSWKISQKLADHFWHRWMQEYLPELQNRRQPYSQGTSMKIGQVVLIADNNLPRNMWPKGIIVAVYPGQDGIIRAVDVRTKGGVMRRATKKLIVLPTDALTESTTTSQEPST